MVKKDDKTFYILGERSVSSKPPGIEVKNFQQLKLPGRATIFQAYDSGEIPIYPERPVLIYDEKMGRMPFDFDRYGTYWLISERCKEVFHQADEDAFSYVECDFELSGGTRGPKYYFCMPLYSFDVVVREKSNMRIKEFGGGRVLYHLMLAERVVIDSSSTEGRHLFHVTHSATQLCDEYFKAQCIDAGLTGITFVKLKT